MNQINHPSTFITSIATALPPTQITQSEAAQLVSKHYQDSLRPRSLSLMQQVLSHPSIQSRYFALDSKDRMVNLKQEDPDKRNERFTVWSTLLASQAAQQAIDTANITRDSITAIVVNTCTGYICPGIGTYLIELLNLPKHTRVYDCVGPGCGGALPTLQLGQALISETPNAHVLCVAVEICSATYQMSDDPSLLISNAIFGDGAAAVILSGQKATGWQLHKSASYFDPSLRDEVRYTYKNGQLHNHLSIHLPEIISTLIKPFVTNLCLSQGITEHDIQFFAIHPGGDKILNAIQQALLLCDTQMEPSRHVLRNYGNMSSPSVLFALKHITQHNSCTDQWCCILGFGAGLSMHGYLIRGVS